MTYYHFCHIALSIDPPWFSVGGACTRWWMPGSGIIWDHFRGWHKGQMKSTRDFSLSCPHHYRLPLHVHMHPQIDTWLEPNQLLRLLEPRKSKASHAMSWLTSPISFFPTLSPLGSWYWTTCSLSELSSPDVCTCSYLCLFLFLPLTHSFCPG